MSSRLRFALLSGVCFGGFVVLMTVRAVSGAVVLGGPASGVLAVLIILFGTAALVTAIVAITVGVEGRLRRMAPILKRRFPDAEVQRIYGEADFQIGLRSLVGDDHAKLPPHFLLMVIRASSVDLFSATSDVALVHVEAAQMVDVRADTVLIGNGNPKPGVELTVKPKYADRPQVVLRFLVMRDTSLTFLNVDLPHVQAVADRIRAVLHKARA